MHSDLNQQQIDLHYNCMVNLTKQYGQIQYPSKPTEHRMRVRIVKG